MNPPLIRKGITTSREIALFILSYKYFGALADNEIKVLGELIRLSEAGPAIMDKHSRGEIINRLSISDSNLSTVMFRLEKKGIIKRDGKAIYLPPLFNKWYNTGEVLIKIID